MTDNSIEHPSNTEEIATVIAEYEEYRERLINETMVTAQKAKLMKKPAMSQLEPELAKIDAILQNLRAQLG